MDKDFSLEWSNYHKHKDGSFGRDTIIRSSDGKAIGRVESDHFKTELEKISLPEGNIVMEKLKDGTVIKTWKE